VAFFAAAVITSCSATAPVDNEPIPVTLSSQFICDQLRSGATVEAVVEWEASEGVPLDEAYPLVSMAVRDTCPELDVLLEDYNK